MEVGDNLIEVLKLGHLYNLPNLVQLLIPRVVEAISLDNCCDILALAITLDVEELRVAGMEFFQRNMPYVFEQRTYVQLKEDNPGMALKMHEIIHQMPALEFWELPMVGGGGEGGGGEGEQ